ncbi:MAG: hypothetical protein WD472_08700, partial [Dehalococcoidia bacterium]
TEHRVWVAEAAGSTPAVPTTRRAWRNGRSTEAEHSIGASGRAVGDGALVVSAEEAQLVLVVKRLVIPALGADLERRVYDVSPYDLVALLLDSRGHNTAAAAA